MRDGRRLCSRGLLPCGGVRRHHGNAPANWLDAGALRPGDRLRTRMADGGAATVAIRSIVEVVDADAPTEVLSISVTPPHTYFAGGALVHNY